MPKGRSIICAALFSAVIWLLLSLILELAPFGSQSLMTIDAYHQYAPFHAELRRKLFEGGSIFYSWSNGLGKDFLGQLAYYTLSPFSLLPLLFSAENLHLSMNLMIVLKSVATCILAAYALKRFDVREGAELSTAYQAALALIYGFSGFFAAFYWNVMWLDAMALLPLLLLGLYELARGFGKWRFILTLAACLITNYFMGVVLLLCSLPLCGALLILEHGRRDLKKALLRLGVFLLSVILAIGLSAFVLFPARGSLGTTDALGLTVDNPWHFFSRFPDVLVQQLMGAQPQVVVLDNPFANAYSGLLPLLLLPAYFVIKEISTKRKIVVGALLFFFYLCMNNEFFDYLIHGFHINKTLPHRFAFVYTALFVLIARRVLLGRKSLTVKALGISIGAIALLAAYSALIAPNMTQPPKISSALLTINLALLAAYAGILLLEKKGGRVYRLLPLLLLVLVASELGYNQTVGIRHSRTNDASHYEKGARRIASLSEHEAGGGFYRSEMLPQITNNDGSLYGYKAMATFNSIINLNTSSLLRSLGYPASAVAYNFADNTPFMTSLLNIRYLYDRTDRDEPFRLLEKSGNARIYENTAVLPLGFMARESIFDFDLSGEGDAFAQQNALAAALAGEDVRLLHPAEMTGYDGENLTLAPLPDGTLYYELLEPESTEKIPVAAVSFRAAYTGGHWLAIDTTHCSMVEIITPYATHIVEMGKLNDIMGLGALEHGDEVTVRLYLRYRYANQALYYPSGDVGVSLAGFDTEAFLDLQADLSAAPFEPTSYSDNTLFGTVEAREDGVLFFSVPYGSGWSAAIGGKRVSPIAVLRGSFLALEVSKGSHEVSLVYETPGWQKGILVSAISALILTAVLIIEKRSNITRRESL